ncbi:hypothetical protein [Paraburkholderia sp.]|uniref:hypothetical protein n=1 Tax=Paraburkholderia sp. TaxID=1926495 RepID=UPI002D64BBC4|nr:hypothetical protein [Paraburkholderia sp.]HZZ04987.1 hypothetical protein [Paraburkholderia sp.]
MLTQRRARTLDLARRAVAALEREHRPVTIATIVAASCELDPEGHGISHSALLNNANARELYEQHRDWRPQRPRSRSPSSSGPEMPSPTKLDRDPRTTRQRLARLTKSDLIERLLIAERAYAALYRCSMKLQARELQEEWNALQAQKLSTVSRDIQITHVSPHQTLTASRCMLKAAFPRTPARP